MPEILFAAFFVVFRFVIIIILLILVATDPLDDVLKFKREYEETFGAVHPTFYLGSYSQVYCITLTKYPSLKDDLTFFTVVVLFLFCCYCFLVFWKLRIDGGKNNFDKDSYLINKCI